MSRIDSIDLFIEWVENDNQAYQFFEEWKHVTGQPHADDDNFWMAREYIRMKTVYATVDFDLPGEINALEHLYPHISIEDGKQNMLAYTPDEQKGKADVQVRTKFGKFLRKYCPDIPDHIIAQEWMPKWNAMTGARAVQFTNDPDEVALIYQHGPTSCMDGRHFKSIHKNPTRVYSSPDCGIAYIGDFETLEFTARAIINFKDKQFTNVYGDPMLKVFLESQGYKQGGLNGCRIRRIPHESDDRTFYAPYIDGSTVQVRFPTKEEDPDHIWLIVEDGGTQARNLNGTITLAHRRLPHIIECTSCGAETTKKNTIELDGEKRIMCPRCQRNIVSYLKLDGTIGHTSRDRTQLMPGPDDEDVRYHIDDMETRGFINICGRWHRFSDTIECCVTGRRGLKDSMLRVIQINSHNDHEEVVYAIRNELAPANWYINKDRGTQLFVAADEVSATDISNDPDYVHGEMLARYIAFKALNEKDTMSPTNTWVSADCALQPIQNAARYMVQHVMYELLGFDGDGIHRAVVNGLDSLVQHFIRSIQNDWYRNCPYITRRAVFNWTRTQQKFLRQAIASNGLWLDDYYQSLVDKKESTSNEGDIAA